MLEHGGKLKSASLLTGIPVEQWLDLSTGIAPWSYASDMGVNEIPASWWHRLPEDDDEGLLKSAAAFYGGGDQWLPIAGSQAAIQALPRILGRKQRVGVCVPSYNEHAHAWRRAGHSIVEFDYVIWPGALYDDRALEQIDILVVCNPNNPTGHHFPPQRLMEISEHLGGRGGWLIVDEAFADSQPHMSVVPLLGKPTGTMEPGQKPYCLSPAHSLDSAPDRIIVLRSLGKFFGLAGARVGFVHSPPAVRRSLAEELGPWALSGPGQYISQRALADSRWHQSMRSRLADGSRRLRQVIEHAGLSVSGQTDFFVWVESPHALQIHEAMRSRAILTRYFAIPPSIRFGLPSNDISFERLAHELAVTVDLHCRKASCAICQLMRLT